MYSALQVGCQKSTIIKIKLFTSRVRTQNSEVPLFTSINSRVRTQWTKALYIADVIIVVLDEATAALSENAEECMYSKMIDLGMTFMSIGQRSSLKKVCTYITYYFTSQ